MQSVAFCPGPRGQRQSLASRCPVRGQPLQRPQPAEPALERLLTTPRAPTASQRLPIHPPRTPERGRARPRVMPVATCRRPSDQRHHRRRSSRTPMAALDSLDSLTDADREHLAPFLHAGPTTARSTALQYVKSDPVSKKEPQGRRILVAAVCAKNPDGGSARELPPCRDPARTHGNTLLGCLLCALDDIMGQQSDYSTIANAPAPHVRTALQWQPRAHAMHASRLTTPHSAKGLAGQCCPGQADPSQQAPPSPHLHGAGGSRGQVCGARRLTRGAGESEEPRETGVAS